jgi:glycosyltransferase involved in cell wall biosynthesis
MDLSIVTTLYHSAAYLPEFHRRVVETAERLGLRFEIIYVNDGSPDDSQAVAEALCDGDSRARVLELSRNFGHHKAIMTGLAEASGELVFLTDADLEEQPEWLAEFYHTLRASGSDVVCGWTSVIISIWLLGVLCLFASGIIGIYLAKVFTEVKRRPYTIVRSVYGRTGPQIEDEHDDRYSQAG